MLFFKDFFLDCCLLWAVSVLLWSMVNPGNAWGIGIGSGGTKSWFSCLQGKCLNPSLSIWPLLYLGHTGAY